MTPYNIFQQDFLKLCDHVLEQDDRMINLQAYTGLEDSQEIKQANEEHVCGTPACLAGYLPEVFPDRFLWDRGGDPLAKCKDHPWAGTDCIWAMVRIPAPCYNEQYYVLSELFNGRWNSFRSDRQEVEIRRKLVADSCDYDKLVKNTYRAMNDAVDPV
jgi:hypothetical protein